MVMRRMADSRDNLPGIESSSCRIVVTIPLRGSSDSAIWNATSFHSKRLETHTQHG